MENKNDIGKAFRDKLKDFDASPDERVWLSIESDLKKEKKRRFFFWWMTTALLFLFGTLLFYDYGGKQQRIENQLNNNADIDAPFDGTLNNGSRNSSRPANTTGAESANQNVGTSPQTTATAGQNNTGAATPSEMGNDNASNANSTGNSILKRNASESTTWTKAHVRNKHLKIRNQLKKLTASHGNNGGSSPIADPTDKNTIASSKNPNANPEDSASQTASTNQITNPAIKTNDTATATIEKTIKNDSLKSNNPKILDKEKDSTRTKSSDWQKLNLFVYATPVYSGLATNKSALDKDLEMNQKATEIELGYGAYLSYTDNKWSLRFGVAITQLRFITRDAIVNTENYAYIDYTANSNASIYAESGNSQTMDIIQDISYIEVPLELKYAIGNGKLGVNAYGGISAMFLGKNEVSAKTANGFQFEMGATENLSHNSFSINAGVGLDYKINRRLRINFEPIFKYHLLDYKNGFNVKPYSISVLTGLQFSLK